MSRIRDMRVLAKRFNCKMVSPSVSFFRVQHKNFAPGNGNITVMRVAVKINFDTTHIRPKTNVKHKSYAGQVSGGMQL
jgi:uncharacterized heparinase superfamily protein